MSNLSYLAFADRPAKQLAELNASCQVKRPHPWFDTFVPDSALDEYVVDVFHPKAFRNYIGLPDRVYGSLPWSAIPYGFKSPARWSPSGVKSSSPFVIRIQQC